MSYLLFFKNNYTYLGAWQTDQGELKELYATGADMKDLQTRFMLWKQNGIPLSREKMSADTQTIYLYETHTPLNDRGAALAFATYCRDQNWLTLAVDDDVFAQVQKTPQDPEHLESYFTHLEKRAQPIQLLFG